MGLINANDILTAVEGSLAGPSNTTQWQIMRKGWYELKFDATNAGTAITSVLIQDPDGKYAYQIKPEMNGLAGGMHNPLSDTQDTFANINLSGGSVTLNESSEVKVTLTHYLHLEVNSILSVNSGLAATLNFIGRKRPITTFTLSSTA